MSLWHFLCVVFECIQMQETLLQREQRLKCLHYFPFDVCSFLLIKVTTCEMCFGAHALSPARILSQTLHLLLYREDCIGLLKVEHNIFGIFPFIVKGL